MVHCSNKVVLSLLANLTSTQLHGTNACDHSWGLERRFLESVAGMTNHLITSDILIAPWFPRLETRMTADINVILQLLQRQITPVPPAYSTVSSSTLPNNSPGLYGTGTPVLHNMYPISPIQMDSRAPIQVPKDYRLLCFLPRVWPLNLRNNKGFLVSLL